MPYSTLRKLHPDSPDPTLEVETVLRIFTRLYLVAGELLEGEARIRVQAQATRSLMAISAAAHPLSEKERKRIARRLEIRNKHKY